MKQRYLLTVLLMLVIAVVTSGLTIQQTDCATNSSYACVKLTGSASGYALILVRADAGHPQLYLPIEDGEQTIATREWVTAHFGGPTPTPLPTATPTPTPLPTATPTPPATVTFSGGTFWQSGAVSGNTIVELWTPSVGATLVSRYQEGNNGTYTFTVTTGRPYAIRVVQGGYNFNPSEYRIPQPTTSLSGLNFTMGNANYFPSGPVITK